MVKALGVVLDANLTLNQHTALQHPIPLTGFSTARWSSCHPAQCHSSYWVQPRNI